VVFKMSKNIFSRELCHIFYDFFYGFLMSFDHPVDGDKAETEEEDMEQDTAESEKSDDDDDSDSGSGSDGDESSEFDEEDSDRRRVECVYDMADLEKTFTDLREQLYKERVSQMDTKLSEVRAGTAGDYLNPLSELQENMRCRTQVAGVLRELKTQNINCRYEAEEQASHQHFLSEKELLYETIHEDLEDKIRRLEEDRHNIDISSDLWNESQANQKKSRRRGSASSTISIGASLDFCGPTEKRRKPVTVVGPYIVYMIKDIDIIDDWTAIKKALKQSQHRKDIMKSEKYPFHARFDDGKLFYESEWYSKGHHIIIDNREDSPVHASITAINTGEVWVKRSDGNKSKLYIAQLQKGKYTIRHVPY